MNESRDHIYDSLPAHARSHHYADQEESMVLGDEDNVSNPGDARRSSHSPTNHRLRHKEHAAFAQEIHPPSLFDAVPPAPANHIGPRVTAPVTSYSVFDANYATRNAVDSSATPVLIPIQQAVIGPVARPYRPLMPQPGYVPPSIAHSMYVPPSIAHSMYVPPSIAHSMYVPPSIAHSMLSREGSAVKLMSKVKDAEEAEEAEYRKACNTACIVCWLIIALILLIGAATAAAVLQLL